MAKAQPKKKSNPMKWLLIGGGAIIIYLVAFPADNTPAKTAAKPAAKKKAANQQDYTAEDIKRSEHPYDALKVPVANAFKPAVFRPAGGTDKTGWPTDLGGPGWTYSGMAVVDGKKQGMLENSSTGETVMLQKNDSWSGAKVSGVYDDHMVFNRPDGPYTVHVEVAKDTSTSAPTASTALPAPMAPMPIPGVGPIGQSGIDMSVVQDGSADTGTGRGNGRRRRRNAG